MTAVVHVFAERRHRWPVPGDGVGGFPAEDPVDGIILSIAPDPLTHCVLLWPREGREEELASYENRVLQLLPDHGARVLQRLRSHGQADQPLEVHILEFPGEEALAGYMEDERHQVMSVERDAAIARTEVIRVDAVPELAS